MSKMKSFIFDLFDDNKLTINNSAQVQNAEFWTTDRDAYLSFGISRQGSVIDKAIINLYNKSDKSLLIDAPMTILNNEARFKVNSDVMSHFGKWSAQVIFNDKYTSPTVDFEILRALGSGTPDRIGLIHEWEKLNNEVKSFVAEIEGFTLDQFVELKMGEELANLETNYATRLTGLEQKDNQLTAQLAQNANYYWIPETQPPARVDEPNAFINGFNGNAIYYEENLFEPFLDSHPDYVKREFVSKDTSGQYDINRYIFAPKNYNKTVIIQTCLHGGEVTPMLVMARFLHYLVNHWESNRELGNIRNNVRIVYTPIANPWGVSQTPRTRQNSNGVDLNRNFDYKWAEFPQSEPFSQNYKGTSPNSEVETLAVIDTIKAYPDATTFLDFHNTGSPMRDIYIDLPENYKYNVYDNIIDYFLRDVEYPDVLLDKNNFPKFGNYMYENYQHIAASTPEWCDTRFGGTTYSSTEITQALEWFGNVIIEHVREFTGKERVRMVNNLELTNEATNGDLSDELTGWLRAGIENETVENGLLKATANGVNFPPSINYWLNKGQIKGDRIFASAEIIAPDKCERIELRVRNNDNPSWNAEYLVKQIDNLNPGQKVRISGDYIFNQDITSVALMVAFIMESNTPDIKGEPIAVGKLFYIPLTEDSKVLSATELDYIIENNEWFTSHFQNNYIVNANFLESYERDMLNLLLN